VRPIVGKIRQSAVIMNCGPGAIIDFRVPGSGAAVSVVAAGLQEWENQADEAQVSIEDLRRLREPRLAEKLGVQYFRLPPVAADKPDGEEVDSYIPLVGVRFPRWLQCPKCNLLKRNWQRMMGSPERYCSDCSAPLPRNEKAYAIPVRFIMSCRNGHLNDFPWRYWVHGGTDNDPECQNETEFELINEGSGLAGLIASCKNEKCEKQRSMEHIFKPDAFEGWACEGGRPWLAGGDEECTERPITMQRGASNLYFPRHFSALVIPPWSERFVRSLGHHWATLCNVEEDDRHPYIRIVWNELDSRLKEMGEEEFIATVDQKINESNRASSGNLRWDEYRQFTDTSGQSGAPDSEFAVRSEPVPAQLPHLGKLLRVTSLREIRALASFTRIEPPPGHPQPVRVQELQGDHNWLPAIDIRGEGIFFSLSEDRLAQWESTRLVRQRAARIQKPEISRVLSPDPNEQAEPDVKLVARYLLLHSLAHVLMKQLSLQCGYSSASLRERIYVGTEQGMAGILIYTATADADGTLGGLQRQGQARRFAGTFSEAIRACKWCSSDPLCIKGLVAASESSNLATCHSCLLAPETSCEDFNQFLDRAMLIGTPEDPSIGFFSDLTGSGEAG